MFYVGQKVVAVDNHSDGLFKNGQVFTVLHIDISKCNCKKQLIYIGIDSDMIFRRCTDCGYRTPKGRWCWFDTKKFAPLEEYTDSMSIAMQLVQELDQTDKAKTIRKLCES